MKLLKSPQLLFMPYVRDRVSHPHNYNNNCNSVHFNISVFRQQAGIQTTLDLRVCTRVGTLIVATIYLQLIEYKIDTCFEVLLSFSVVTSIVYNPLPAMWKS